MIKKVIIYFSLLGSLILFVSCTSKSTSKDLLVTKKSKSDSELPALFSLGFNEQPHFSLDGQKYLFISTNRKQHKNSQAYEYSLATSKERRVTFQDGQVQNPTYLNNEWIVYDSSTDEIKESILEKDRASSEIYLSDLVGDNIYRLTDRKGPDHKPMVATKNEVSIYYFEDDSKERSIMQIRFTQFPESNKKSVFLKEKGRFPISMTLSPDEKWLFWLEFDKQKNISYIYKKNIGLKTFDLAFSVKGQLNSIQKLNNENYFLASYINNQSTNQNVNYKLIILDSVQLCAIKILENKFPILDPDYSNSSPASVIFTMEESKLKNIHIYPLKHDLGSCEPLQKE